MRTLLLACLIAGTTAACGGADDVKGDDAARRWPIDAATGLRVPEIGPVPALPDWPDNAPSAAKGSLGALIFNDARLSGSKTIPCAGCHAPTGYFQDSTSLTTPARSFPYGTPTLRRNTPSLLNLIYAPVFRWDGSHSTDLIDVLSLPFAEANMNLTPGVPRDDVERVDVPLAQATLKARLTSDIPGYVPLFKDAFGEDITAQPPERVWRLVGSALAVYLRRAVSRDSAFDRWNRGENVAMSDAALRGLELFTGKGQCIACHRGPLLSDFQFHNISTSPPDAHGDRPDDGHYLATQKPEDKGKFLTPTLRSVDATSPYLHNGSFTQLRDVIRLKTGPDARRDPLHDPMLDGMAPLDAQEVDDLVAFMKTLRGAAIPYDQVLPPTTFP